MLEQPKRRPLIEQGHLPGDTCRVTSEEIVPLRTAKDHAALRTEPLEAIQAMQDVMCNLLLFECNECHVRFPAFHPEFDPTTFEPMLELQITKHCRNNVAVWDAGMPPPPEDCARRAPDAAAHASRKSTTKRTIRS